VEVLLVRFPMNMAAVAVQVAFDVLSRQPAVAVHLKAH
jgi:hypothetical protein